MIGMLGCSDKRLLSFPRMRGCNPTGPSAMSYLGSEHPSAYLSLGLGRFVFVFIFAFSPTTLVPVSSAPTTPLIRGHERSSVARGRCPARCVGPSAGVETSVLNMVNPLPLILIGHRPDFNQGNARVGFCCSKRWSFDILHFELESN